MSFESSENWLRRPYRRRRQYKSIDTSDDGFARDVSFGDIGTEAIVALQESKYIEAFMMRTAWQLDLGLRPLPSLGDHWLQTKAGFVKVHQVDQARILHFGQMNRHYPDLKL
jgi:hypothetical protein